MLLLILVVSTAIQKPATSQVPYTLLCQKAKQKEALAFIQKNLFETPVWLIDKKLLDLLTAPTSDRISSIQDNMLGSLLSNSRLQRLISSGNREKNTYHIDEYLSDLKKEYGRNCLQENLLIIIEGTYRKHLLRDWQI